MTVGVFDSHAALPTITPAQLEAMKAQFSRTAEDRVLFHWTNFENWKRWSATGELSREEFHALISNHVGMVSGGGFYMASETESSRSFGDFLMKIRIPKGTLIYDGEVVRKILGLEKPLSNEDKVELGQKIEFIEEMGAGGFGAESQWAVTHSYSLVSKSGNTMPLRNAHSETLFGGAHSTNFEDTLRLLSQQGDDASNIYARRLLGILYRGNIEAFMKALYLHPSQVEQMFGNSEMLRLEAGMSKWLSGYKKFVSVIDVKTNSKVTWVNAQLDILLQMFIDFTGDPVGSAFRKNPLSSQTLQLDPFQAKKILDNPDLSAEVLSEDGFKTTLKFQYLAPQNVPARLAKALGEMYDSLQFGAENPIGTSWAAHLKTFSSLAPFSKSNDLLLRTYFSFLGRATGSFWVRPLGRALSDRRMVHDSLVFFRMEDPLLETVSSLQSGIFTAFPESVPSSFAALDIAYGLLAEMTTARRLRRTPEYQNLPEQTLMQRRLLDDESRVRINAAALAKKLSENDLVGVSEIMRGTSFWISDFKVLSELIEKWKKSGRIDLVQKVVGVLQKFLADGDFDEEKFAALTRLNIAPMSRKVWMNQILDSLPRFTEGFVIGAIDVGIALEYLVFQQDLEARSIGHDYVLHKFFPPISDMASRGQFAQLKKLYGANPLNSFNRIEVNLGLNRAWSLDFLSTLVQAFNAAGAEEFRATLFDAVIHSQLLTAAQNDASFREGLKLFESCLHLLKPDGAPSTFGGPTLTLHYGIAMIDQKLISASTVKELIRILAFSSHQWIDSVPTVLELIEKTEHQFPGSLQGELAWLSNNLETLEPDLGARKAYADRIQKLLKSTDAGPSPSAFSCSALTGSGLSLSKPQVSH